LFQKYAKFKKGDGDPSIRKTRIQFIKFNLQP
jgi:hypothetical protein